MTVHTRDLTQRPPCPLCGGRYVKHDGHVANGDRRYMCKPCGRKFTLERTVPQSKGSGVVAAPRVPNELRELRRDPFEFMKLAMMTRKPG